MSDVTLYRCECRYCEFAEEDLSRLCLRHDAKMEVKRVETDLQLANYIAWSTPLVYIHGRLVSRYALSHAKWDEAIRSAAQG